MSNKRYVITGGPGVGKTTVIELLGTRGYTVIPEVSRSILEQEIKKDSDMLPWKDHVRFQDEVAQKQLELEARQYDSIIFFDRGLIDGCAYYNLRGTPIPTFIQNVAKKRYEKIFLLEQLETYVKDDVRIEDRELGMKIHEEIRKAYLEWGYELVSVPPLSPSERVDFILRHTI